jgi:hypothetical protein
MLAIYFAEPFDLSGGVSRNRDSLYMAKKSKRKCNLLYNWSHKSCKLISKLHVSCTSGLKKNSASKPHGGKRQPQRAVCVLH